MTVAEMRAEALARAVGGKSTANWGAIIQGFMDRGIPADEITPRENVFTYRAWQALGRQVRKGEKGVRVSTRIPCSKRTGKIDPKTGGERVDRFTAARTVSVFHITQTDPMDGAGPFGGDNELCAGCGAHFATEAHSPVCENA